MRFATLQAAIGSASLFLSVESASIAASHGHHHVHNQIGRRHAHQDELVGAPAIAKRSTCSLPDHPDLVFVPGEKNNGFAIAPDMACKDGMYCPIACVSGKVMAQWQPNSTYVYPQSTVSSRRSSFASDKILTKSAERRPLLQRRDAREALPRLTLLR